LEYFDCSACEKEHEFDPVVGDVHYDRRSGKSYVYDGAAWTEYKPTSSTSWTSGSTSTVTWTSGPLGPTAPYPPPPPLKFKDPTDYKFDDIGVDERRVFVSKALEKHKLDGSLLICACGIELIQMPTHDLETTFSLHLADIAVAACDEWDERQMEGE
jgi:hypothetical protein